MPDLGQWNRVDGLCEKYHPTGPYVYCGANPVRLIDINGNEPTPAEAARIAAHVYGNKTDDILIGGWRVSKRIFGLNLEDETGLKSLIYERVINGNVTEYVYATAGSEVLVDWKENIKQPLGISKQYIKSANNAKILSEILGKKELNFVGHSFGGGEAALNSLVTSGYRKGRKAFTFNAAGVGSLTKFSAGGWDSNSIMPSVNGNRHYLWPQDIQSIFDGHSIDSILKSFDVDPNNYNKP